MQSDRYLVQKDTYRAGGCLVHQKIAFLEYSDVSNEERSLEREVRFS